jgi:membrane protein required for colicin V production
MYWLDIIIIVLIAIAALIGLRIGIIRAVLSLVGVIVGVVLAGRFYGSVAGGLTFIPQETLAKIVAFAIILVGVMLVAGVLASVLKWSWEQYSAALCSPYGPSSPA